MTEDRQKMELHGYTNPVYRASEQEVDATSRESVNMTSFQDTRNAVKQNFLSSCKSWQIVVCILLFVAVVIAVSAGIAYGISQSADNTKSSTSTNKQTESVSTFDSFSAAQQQSTVTVTPVILPSVPAIRTSTVDTSTISKAVTAAGSMESSSFKTSDVDIFSADRQYSTTTKLGNIETSSTTLTTTSTSAVANVTSLTATDATTESLPSIEPVLIIVAIFNGTTLNQDVVHINLEQKNKVRNMGSSPSYVEVEAAAATVGDSFYAVGIGRRYLEHWIWTNQGGWEKMSSLPSGRRRHCVATVGSDIYVVGGYVDATQSALNSILRYNTKTDTWSTVGKLALAVGVPACLAYNESIYIFGGNIQGGNATNKVQVYNTVTRNCSLLTDMPISTNLARAVLWETTAIIFAPDVCFLYNFETQQWDDRDQFSTDNGHFGLIIYNQTLFLVGGCSSVRDIFGGLTWICSDEIKYVPVKTVMLNKAAAWKLHARLPQAGAAHVYNSAPLMVSYGSLNK